MLGRFPEAAGLIAEAAGLAADLSPATLAEIERVKGKLLGHLGYPHAARRHFDRALRIFDVVPNAVLRQDVLRDREALLAALEQPDAPDPAPPPSSTLETTALLLELAANPELLGREVIALVAESDWAHATAVIARSQAGTDVLATHGWTTGEAARLAADSASALSAPLGRWQERDLSLLIQPREHPMALSAAVALQRLIAAAVALEQTRQEEKRRAALWSFEPPGGTADGIFLSMAMLEVVAIARKIAPTNLPVLITGETGTGKELLAQIIHKHSAQSDKPFVAFNCTAIPRDLVESQLFGHRRGAFTGAQDHFPGIIRTAAGGTLFLDEIGELSADVQPKLLRFLETGEVHPLGAPHPSSIDVRVLAATNVDLDQLVAAGRFREDLFYRLNVIRLRIPPLRERREEIPPLLNHFIERYSSELRKRPPRLSEEALEYVLLFPWPGNVRQLANEIRRIVALADPGGVVLPDHLSPEIRASRRTLPSVADADGHRIAVRIDQPLAAAVGDLERVMVQLALRNCGGHMDTAARALGISRKGLYLKRQRLGVPPAAPR